MKAIMFSVVEASVAANGPTGVAYQIHQTVIAFQSVKASSDQPKTRHHERREASYEALIHNRGTNAAKRPRPVAPSHPAESRRADRRTAANLSTMECEILRRQK